MDFRNKIEMQFSSNNMRAAWESKQWHPFHSKIIAKDPNWITVVGDTNLPKCFNSFFSCFEGSDFIHNIFNVRNPLVIIINPQWYHRSMPQHYWRRVILRRLQAPMTTVGTPYATVLTSSVESFKGFELHADDCVLLWLWKTSNSKFQKAKWIEWIGHPHFTDYEIFWEKWECVFGCGQTLPLACHWRFSVIQVMQS